ncbi:hypothetical protein GYMLUDRAFT_46527 [Collybiopsis luxurians FD-317 M1]|uniref:UBC core domain-containing protein n=1 Tax=Collybiopsis luxurians FD-317 M1 TaxID=944289 RepID=A0A0D0C4A3_9AGAR|nr:hypothetical protein GYMLUDRAFT_46527 [Collybiopsis luxurians FD-317 M1]
MSITSHRLLTRLYGDLAELRDAPYPGVSVFTDDANIYKLCLVLTPPSGPWKDLSLHFDVQIPENWPASPPKIRSTVEGIGHPNLFGGYVCCDLLKQVYSGRGYDGGYTPALTLRGLFLQFLTFFSSSKVEQVGGRVLDIGDCVQRKFVLEKDLQALLEDIEIGASYPLSRYSTAHLPQNSNEHAALARKWDADQSPELELGRYQGANQGASGIIIHKTKSMAPHPQRIHALESESPQRRNTRQLLQQTAWKCKTCPYGSRRLPYDATEIDEIQDVRMEDALEVLALPSTCALDMLPDDCLYVIAALLPSESIISFSEAYPRFRNLVDSSHELLRRELTCFFLRTSLQDSILGIGVALDAKARVLSSDFDWLSEEAFTKHNVRLSIRKNSFGYFLPLAFNRYHFHKARTVIWRCLRIIDTDLRLAQSVAAERAGRGYFKPVDPLVNTPERKHEEVRVVFQMMNNVVVSLMKSCDNVLASRSNQGNLLRASERAVYAYCHLFHLAICLVRTTPAIFDDAETTIRHFVEDPVHRVKARVPDMGELIVKITLVLALAPSKGTNISWENISGPVLEEVIIRNVLWVLKDSPELAVMERGRSNYRLALTLLRSKTSLRLVMFQIAFLNMFVSTYSSNLSYLDEHYGFPHKQVPEKMVEEIKDIYTVDTWFGFFQKVNFAKGAAFGPDVFSDMLRQAVRTSAQRGYHSPAQLPRNVEKTRADLEGRWKGESGW